MKYKNRFDVPDDRGPLYYLSDEHKQMSATISFSLAMALTDTEVSPISTAALELHIAIFGDFTKEELDQLYAEFIESRKNFDDIKTLKKESKKILTLLKKEFLT